MNSLTIINFNGQLVTDSREVAEMIEIRHDNLLAKIKGYVEILDSSKLRSQDFFIESTYINSQNKEQPCYLLTKKGCDMVANKMTGEKGILFTAIYVTNFEDMEKQLKSYHKQLSPMDQLKLQYQVLETHEERLDKLENNMPLFNVECKELQSLVKKIGIKVLGGYKSPAYNDNSLRGKVYSDIQHQLRREFGVSRYEAIKRVQFETAKKIVEEYKAPIVLADEIQLSNNQMSYKDVI